MIFELPTYLYHYAACVFTMVLPAVGVSIGQGIISFSAMEALTIQPNAQSEISRIYMIALVLVETSAILGFIMGLRLIYFGASTGLEYAPFIHYSELGILLALGVSGCVVGIASSLPARQACLAVARQPFFSSKIQLLMLITQSLMQTPVIFGLIVAIIIMGQLSSVTDLNNTLRIIGSGLCIGIGSIGPVIGFSLLAQQACKGSGINRSAYTKIFSFTAISFALIESTIIFCLVVTLFLLNLNITDHTNITGIRSLIAGGTMALGTLGVGIASGLVTAVSCRMFSQKPEIYTVVSQSSLFSQIFIETCAVYCLVIAMIFIFF